MKKFLSIILTVCVFITMFSCVAYADFEIVKGEYLWFLSETFPSLGEIIEQMILPEFKSADTLPELIMAAIRSVNGLLFAAPFYIIAVLGIFSF